MPRIVKLVNVSEANNNKAYEMYEQTDGTWLAKWGRVGYRMQEQIYQKSEWDKKYKEKIKKGYRDITDLVSVETANDTNTPEEPELKISGFSKACMDLVNFLQSSARSVVRQNYTVKVADVTQKQVDAAQEILDRLALLSSKTWDRKDVNATLLELYRTIPRKMSNTKLFLIQDDDKPDKLPRILSNEQDLLDTMAGQVATQAQTTVAKDKKQELILDIEMREATPEELNEIKKCTDLDFSKVAKVFRVTNKKTGITYSSFYSSTPRSRELLLFHGSRNENWWSIINSGLKIRPTNAIHTGSMFGDGLYFANKARKSIGYTSLRGSYWASGSANKAYLALYQVNVGDMWQIVHGDSSLNLRKVKAAGHDTVFAKGGADLINDEHIAYESERSTIKYLIELRG
jgi:poly [ADP-ribose] polymerase